MSERLKIWDSCSGGGGLNFDFNFVVVVGLDPLGSVAVVVFIAPLSSDMALIGNRG